jgi:hypothetical protein
VRRRSAASFGPGDATVTYPSVDECRDRLHRPGWSGGRPPRHPGGSSPAGTGTLTSHTASFVNKCLGLHRRPPFASGAGRSCVIVCWACGRCNGSRSWALRVTAARWMAGASVDVPSAPKAST